MGQLGMGQINSQDNSRFYGLRDWGMSNANVTRRFETFLEKAKEILSMGWDNNGMGWDKSRPMGWDGTGTKTPGMGRDWDTN